jgi:Mrp family chromosome partitioning ATPase
MAKGKSRGKGPPDKAGPLVLSTADGTPVFTCHPDAVESYRHMLARLTREAPLPARIALVTALPEEGVTTNAIGLGLTLATDLPASVCVVELNWWRPGLARLLGGLPGPGLADAPALEQAFIRTSLPNLALIAAGALPVEERPATARSQQLKDTIEQLGQQFNTVLLDVPAILATSDAIPLASLAEACCLVIRQGATPMNTVKRALDDVSHMKILGIILNRVRIATPRFIREWIPDE